MLIFFAKCNMDMIKIHCIDIILYILLLLTLLFWYYLHLAYRHVLVWIVSFFIHKCIHTLNVFNLIQLSLPTWMHFFAVLTKKEIFFSLWTLKEISFFYLTIRNEIEPFWPKVFRRRLKIIFVSIAIVKVFHC